MAEAGEKKERKESPTDRALMPQGTCGEVVEVRTISSSCMTCAGEKKCAPRMRGRAEGVHLAPTRSMSIVDVLVALRARGIPGRGARR